MPASADRDTVVAATRLTYATDVRSVLPSVRCSSIVLARRGDVLCPFDEVAWVADHVGGARFVPLDGGDRPFWAGDTSVLLDELESFVTALAP